MGTHPAAPLEESRTGSKQHPGPAARGSHPCVLTPILYRCTGFPTWPHHHAPPGQVCCERLPKLPAPPLCYLLVHFQQLLTTAVPQFSLLALGTGTQPPQEDVTAACQGICSSLPCRLASLLAPGRDHPGETSANLASRACCPGLAQPRHPVAPRPLPCPQPRRGSGTGQAARGQPKKERSGTGRRSRQGSRLAHTVKGNGTAGLQLSGFKMAVRPGGGGGEGGGGY